MLFKNIKWRVLLKFFNKLVRVDNKFFFHFFELHKIGVHSSFFSRFLRIWVTLLRKVYYNYIQLKVLSKAKMVRSGLYLRFTLSFFSLILNKKRLNFNHRFFFYPHNRQVYVRSCIQNGGFSVKFKRFLFKLKKKKLYYLNRQGRLNRLGRRRIFMKNLKRFRRLSYKFVSRFDFSNCKFFDSRFLLLRKSFYFFKVNRLLRRSRKSFVNFFRKHIIQFIIKEVYFARRLVLLRKKLTNDFRDLLNNRFFLYRLRKLYVRIRTINFYNLYLIGIKLYLGFRLRCFLVGLSIFLSRSFSNSFSSNVCTDRKYRFNSSKLFRHKSVTVLKFLGLKLEGKKFDSRKNWYLKKSFFYFFTNPIKKIKKRFFLRLKKIKKRFFQPNIVRKNFIKNVRIGDKKGGSTNFLAADISKNSMRVSRCFLKKTEFFSGLSQKKKSRNISSGFVFFGQRFLNKKSDIKVLTLLRSLYRIGRYKSFQILLKFRRTFNMRLSHFSTKFRVNLEVFLRTLIISETFKRMEEDNFSKKLSMRSYHSTRFRLRLPIRGQRTHSNAGTPKRLHNAVKNVVS